MKWVEFWLRCLTLAWLIGLAAAWLISLASNVVYKGRFWLSLKELNEVVAVGEGALFLIVATYSIYWLVQIVREVIGR
jgi:hypothetical protein